MASTIAMWVCGRTPANAISVDALKRPDAGSQPSFTENSSLSSMPTKNTGAA